MIELIGLDGFADWFRAVEGISSILVLVLLVWRIFRVWKFYHISQKMIFAALLFYNIQQAGRAYENITKGTSVWSFWLIFGLIGNLILFAYLWEPRDLYKERLGEDPRYPHSEG